VSEAPGFSLTKTLAPPGDADGNADDDAFVDRGMLADRLLDHARIDVVARREDQVLERSTRNSQPSASM
jgi:hypothetical protein